ncbi:SMI1/KNR4 family protein [Chitinophaga nivalis]|uniref:SMI1/KNR4 family protein n=1 Tax=Chitinophaga nivalis TaxID=2991709 RepID=A0ABT3IQM3_9BACT|nr:SMI1/KNR4 family protein [Chitinophaga nivalis]MCW3464013.1 SMI1/KNR4 family protein [Chitinophaga nivalis]MCW3486297.1 SMI1/KNR4 family protein [Chitinophaga nivalis]
MMIAHIEQKIGKQLPDSYRHLLHLIADYVYLSCNEYRDDFPDDSGVAWFFWGEKRLAELTVIEGATENRSAWEILKSYEEIRRDTGKITPDPMSAHVNFLVAIAEDNGDILYLDAADNFSVWVYMHDSGASKRLEDDFDAWMAHARSED